MIFPIDLVRERFPALAIEDAGKARIYLDNPAGTQVPQMVADAVASCLVQSNANLGGFFASSQRAGEVVQQGHEAAADFVGANGADEIIIGANMTSLTFQLSRSICKDFAPGDEIVLTRMDHEGDIAPWLEMAEEKQLIIRWLRFDPESWQLEPAALEELLSDRTRLVALNYASNLTGSINDLKALTERSKQAGALVYVDAVQFAPHGLIDVQNLGCDFLTCSSYKFFGPHLGLLWGRRELLQDLHAYQCRCVSDELPTKFETGTPQIELQAGLAATVDYFAWLGAEAGEGGGRRAQIAASFAMAQAHETLLVTRLISGLQSIPGVTIHGITNPDRMGHRVPTVAFTCDQRKPAEIAERLADRNIFVWSGHNYAPEIVRQLGIPEDEGVVRIGIAHYNAEAEIDRTLDALEGIIA